MLGQNSAAERVNMCKHSDGVVGQFGPSIAEWDTRFEYNGGVEQCGRSEWGTSVECSSEA